MERRARIRSQPESALSESAHAVPVDYVLEELAAGERALIHDGDLASARLCFDGAARAALSNGDTEGLARASLGLGGLWVHEHRTSIDAARVSAWQRTALERLDPSRPLSARLSVRLAAEADYAEGTSDRVLAAVDNARAMGDPVTLAEALSLAHHCLLGPEHGALRLDLADELLGVAALTGRPVDEVLGALWRTVDLLLAGDPHAERSLQELTDVTARYGLRAVEFVLAAIDVMRSIRRGDFEDAEQQAKTCAERGYAVGDVDALGWYVAQLVAIRWYQGRLGELVPLLTEAAHSPTLAGPDDSIVAALAVATGLVGNRTEAVSALRRLRGEGLKTLRPSSTWLVTLSGVTEIAAILGDGKLAAEAYALLKPFASLPVMASLAVVCFGSVHHPLGVAALTMGRRDRARHHFEAAVVANEALPHRPALALSRQRLAELDAARDGRRKRPAATCRREGTRWRIEASGHLVFVPDSVGMRYIATLVSHPGREIPAAYLAGVPDAGGGSPDPLLDDAARRAYNQRLKALRSEIDQAGDDAERRARAESELDWMVRELTRASRLGGKSRDFLDAPERARTSVQKAIRRALERIRTVDPEMARDLQADLVTGLHCCYQPPGSTATFIGQR